METLYDWLAILAFAGLITLFLQRSSEDVPRDTIWQYMPPAIGCAVSNYAGNEGYGWLAILILAGVGYYVYVVLKPFPSQSE